MTSPPADSRESMTLLSGCAQNGHFKRSPSLDLSEPSHVPFAPFELRLQPDVHDLPREADADDAPSERQHVRVVVRAAEASREDVRAVGGADARVAVGDDGHADAGAVDEDGAVELAARHARG